MRSIFLFVAILINGPSLAATITFEEGSDYYGFVFESLAYNFSVGGPAEDQFLLIENSPFDAGAAQMSTLSGEAFSLSSLSVSYTSAKLTGYYAGGGIVQTDWVSGDIILGPEWQGLESVRFDGSTAYFFTGLDDIVVSTVPVPAAVWLFGSALAGLGWLKRKQSA